MEVVVEVAIGIGSNAEKIVWHPIFAPHSVCGVRVDITVHIHHRHEHVI